MPADLLTARFGAAYRALVHLSSRSRSVKISEISEAEGIGKDFLARILLRLKAAGLVRSVRGRGGGYLVSRPPSEITLLDIWEAIEGDISPGECPSGGCPRYPGGGECGLVNVLNEAEDAMKEVLASHDLESMSATNPSAAMYHI